MKRVAGNYTLEAAFIVPVIFGIIFAIIFFLFFEHDKAVMYGNLSEEIRKVSLIGEETKDYKKNIQKNCWIFQVERADLSSGNSQVKGEVVATASWKIPVMESFLKNKQKITISLAQSLWQPEERIRYRLGKKGNSEE